MTNIHRTSPAPRPVRHPQRPHDGDVPLTGEETLSAPPRRSRRALVAALGSFGGACVLAGVAAFLSLEAITSQDTSTSTLACAVVTVAAALLGAGVLLSRRERRLSEGERRHTSRVERIQRELDLLGLTPKEMTVARLILQHHSYGDIARTTGLSPRTVQFHASNAFHKAYVTRRRDFERLILADPVPPAEATYEQIPRLRPDQVPPLER